MFNEDNSKAGLFPLTGSVLLPGSLLPLHVFETRYQQLVRDALDGSQQIGVARLISTPTDDNNCSPIHPFVGLAEILSHREMRDGRFHVLLRGVGRAKYESDLASGAPYRVAAIKEVSDVAPAKGELRMKSLYKQLIAVSDQLSYALSGGGDEIRKMVRGAKGPGQCADILSGALIADPDMRQKILECLDPADRIDLVLTHVSRLLVEVSPREAMPN